MKKRIISIVCAVAILATMLSVGIVSSLADTENTEKPKGEKIVPASDATFSSADWEGDVDGFNSEDGTFGVGSNNKKTVWTVKSYDLSGGFKFSADLKMKNTYNNYEGEYCSIYIDDPISGLELRVQNRKGVAMYDAYLYLAGKELGSFDLINDPNGEYEIVYKDGKVTVNYKANAIAWKLADGSTSTSVSVADADFSNAKIGLTLQGNWCPAGERKWKTYSIASLAADGSGTGGTGDARNIVVPAVVLVISACAVAFVATRKKTNA